MLITQFSTWFQVFVDNHVRMQSLRAMRGMQTFNADERAQVYHSKFKELNTTVIAYLTQELAAHGNRYKAEISVYFFLVKIEERDRFTVKVMKNRDESSTYDGTEVSAEEYARESCTTAHTKYADDNGMTIRNARTTSQLVMCAAGWKPVSRTDAVRGKTTNRTQWEPLNRQERIKQLDQNVRIARQVEERRAKRDEKKYLHDTPKVAHVQR